MKIHCQDCNHVIDDDSHLPIEFDRRAVRRCDPCEERRVERESTGRIPWDIDFDMPAGPQRQQ